MYVKPEEAERIHDRGYTFLRLAKRASLDALRRGCLRWHVFPKWHVLRNKFIEFFSLG